jgi:hypothetical protein
MPTRVLKCKQNYPTIYIHLQAALPAGLFLAEGHLMEDQQNTETLRIFCAGTRKPTPIVTEGQELTQL